MARLQPRAMQNSCRYW